MASPAANDIYTCPRCAVPAARATLAKNAYRCPRCDLQVAHLKFAADGTIVGFVAWLQPLGAVLRSRLIAVVLAIAFFSGCALTDEPQSGQFILVKPGMDRATVVQNLGTPPQSQIANGRPVLDSWACESNGQVVEIKMSAGWLIAEYILTLGIAGLVDAARFYKVQQRVNKCDVQYDADGKVERTSSTHGAPVVQTP